MRHNLYGYVLLTYTVLLAIGAFTLSVVYHDHAFTVMGVGLVLLAGITGLVLLPRTDA